MYPKGWSVIRVTEGKMQHDRLVFNMTNSDWNINSGIKQIVPRGDEIDFHGISGSLYTCRLEDEGKLSLYCKNTVEQQFAEPLLRIYDVKLTYISHKEAEAWV